MTGVISLIPLFPLLSAVVLFVTMGKLPRVVVAVMGAGSVAASALVVAFVAVAWLGETDPVPVAHTVYTWMATGGLSVGLTFYLDGLSLTMLMVITGVGFLIHVYSTAFMWDDPGISRFFTCMNLFVAAMIVLVLADNLLLLYLGWEGVGVCSYLLVGFWYSESENGQAARKAFVVTRIGGRAMALGLLLLFTELGTLDIQALVDTATVRWADDNTLATVAALLLLGGAVGKSAQLPLQTWLPDAMAGPTPVSALIHAATMVTAGVYLVARMHGLYELSPLAQQTVGVIGLATLIVAAFAALNQTDIKRILAYSTISQIGYMFLALGVGAWTASIFHLMTHAFFKALLFLSAGAVIYSLHHEHNIFAMGGLRKALPLAFVSFVVGSAALAALPLTAGFASKDAILMAAWEHGNGGGLLWAGGALGALLTAIYSFRLVFVVFLGEQKTRPDAPAGLLMAIPLGILAFFSIVGGLISVPAASALPASEGGHNTVVEVVTAVIPFVGVAIAWLVYGNRTVSLDGVLERPGMLALRRFFASHWALDWLFDRVLVRPYYALAALLRNEVFDWVYMGIVALASFAHRQLSTTQTGQLRTYAVTMVAGLVLLFAVLAGVL